MAAARIVISLIFVALFAMYGNTDFDGNYAHAQNDESADEPNEIEYKVVEGYFQNEELGFGLALPDSLKGFAYEYDFPDGSKGLTLQIHPKSNSTGASDLPAIEITPAAFLLESGPLNMTITPVPITGDLYAAIQGYKMRMSIEELDNTEVLAATLNSERNDLPGHDTVKRVGKFYFMNSDAKYVSYGLWASEENYQEYLDEFEESARSLTMTNARPVDLQPMFSQYILPDKEFRLNDGSVLRPEIITPSIIESIGIAEDTNVLRINISEPTGYSFLIVNSAGLLAGPHSMTIDGDSTEFVTLSNENGEYLLAYFDDVGNHEFAITGTAVIPEFGVIAIFLMALSMIGAIFAAKGFVK